MNSQKNTVGLVAFIEAHATFCTLLLYVSSTLGGVKQTIIDPNLFKKTSVLQI